MIRRMNAKARRRITISIPETTLRLLDKVAPKGDRSRFITEAVHAYVASRNRTRLKAELEAGAIASASRDLALVAEWSSLDLDTLPGRKRSPRGGVGHEIKQTRPAHGAD
jgi:hypothetical protein